MAYNLDERFPSPPKYYRLLDPGSYHNADISKSRPNKAPFLSKTPRNTQFGIGVSTDVIYYADLPFRIPNCTSLMSKCPRFPYESFSKEDLEKILCQCGIENYCECSNEEKQIEECICQANIRRRLFKGPSPHSISSEGPKHVIKHSCPPFYDIRVQQSTDFYQGCKWSKWTSERAMKSLEVRPGPPDYTLEWKPTNNEICAEKVRSQRRKTSKQLRFIEMIQQREIIENRPGPATYSPIAPHGTSLKCFGSKANRFPIAQYDKRPGPTHYSIKRDFSPVALPTYKCHAKLPDTECFGIKAPRFKILVDDGPSPASYSTTYTPCKYLNCSKVPFQSSALRFKEEVNDETCDYESLAKQDLINIDDPNRGNCSSPTWEFKSKTKRIKPLIKILDEPSPADFPQENINIHRLLRLQYIAPFYSSEGRFRPWYDWLPIYGNVKTPGPGYYDLEKPKCPPAVYQGPIFRSSRFPLDRNETPAPNTYTIGGGIETVLTTHNERLNTNIQNKYKFKWQPPVDKRKLSLEEQFNVVLQKSIDLLDYPTEEKLSVDEKSEDKKSSQTDLTEKSEKPKLLKCFLYSQKIPQCI